MAFTGKATYSSGATLPEIVEDVSDLVGINAPSDTPLLDALGDAVRPARSTMHEWLEDTLLPNTDTVSDASITDPNTEATFGVGHPTRFRVGDQVLIGTSQEVALVTSINLGGGTITVQRGYGGTSGGTIVNDGLLYILGNAALEGDDAAATRFTIRTRKANYTQIFSATVEVSGSELAVRQLGVADELDYQKQQRTRELMRELENCAINGRAAASTSIGSGSVRRTMNGILGYIASHKFAPGVSGFPSGTALSEAQLNTALKEIWANSNSPVDLIVVGPTQKRAINQFLASNRRYSAEGETYKDMVSVYESDFGVCRIVLSRWMPPGTVLLLDSTRVEVMPLAGRSFHYKPLASTGDREQGQVIGEYTVELRNENAHGVITGLSA